MNRPPSHLGHGAASGVHPVGPPHVSRFHRYTAVALGASMWFWLMYQFKANGTVMLGLQHAWETHTWTSYFAERRKRLEESKAAASKTES
ncbi:hypothetical protein BT63DRAFT_455000 [Microthyrium microscopicum]|uniref:NADH dehydrogenase [ubiquinone] 1 beta subcomplex subunit 2 n=1 Tax=Microthyrium microscopicum TaxID=703497 RepID=A0A6A6U9S6_9PEZI|nr:hypothetical protein BT63DRAFT_455000 [Microthyrium microscopicum]